MSVIIENPTIVGSAGADINVSFMNDSDLFMLVSVPTGGKVVYPDAIPISTTHQGMYLQGWSTIEDGSLSDCISFPYYPVEDTELYPVWSTVPVTSSTTLDSLDWTQIKAIAYDPNLNGRVVDIKDSTGKLTNRQFKIDVRNASTGYITTVVAFELIQTGVADKSTKSVFLHKNGTNYKTTFRIADFDHDSLVGTGANKARITFFMDIFEYGNTCNFNLSKSNVGGYLESDIYKELLLKYFSEYMVHLDGDSDGLDGLKSSISTCLKTTRPDNTNPSEIRYTQEQLFLMSGSEANAPLKSGMTFNYVNEGTAYSYFPCRDSSTAWVRKGYSNAQGTSISSSGSGWYTRSLPVPASGSASKTDAVYVNSSGQGASTAVQNPEKCIICFCI